MEHELQIVDSNDTIEVVLVEFSKAELKRLYNIVYREHEEDKKLNYTTPKIENLRGKLRYYLDE